MNVNKLWDFVTGDASSSAPVSQIAHMRLCCPLLVRGSISPLSATASSDTSTDWLQSTSGKFDSFFISRSACVYSLSTDCRSLYRWWWGRCSPARRRARWRKGRCCSSPLQRNPLNKTNDFIRCPLTGKSVNLCVCLTPEQFDVVHTGYCYLLLLFLIFFFFTPDHRQFKEFQGNDIVVICEPESRTCIQKTPWWSNFRHWRVYLPERSPVKAVAPK